VKSARFKLIIPFVFSTLLTACGDQVDRQSVETAEHFFGAIEQEDFTRAHRFLTRSLAAETSATALEKFVIQTGLGQPGTRSWEDARMQGEQISLSGKIALKDEELEVPVRLNMEKEGVHWKIAGLERGVEVETAKGKVLLYAPSLKDSALLVRQTTAAFASAVQKHSLHSFWEQSSDAFKQQYSADEFKAAFSAFIEDKTNLMPATQLDPEFSFAPVVGLDGELSLAGHFPTRPSRVNFRYSYVRQDNAWKTSGLTISLVPQE